MRIAGIAVAAAALVWAEPAEAQTYVTIYSIGSLSCGDHLRTYYPGPQDREYLKAWLAGYLSGYNVYTMTTSILGSADIESAMAWLDNYCRANPLNGVPMGIHALVETLKGR